MKIKHRALSLVLVFALCLCLLPTVSAAGTNCSYAVIAGGVSHSLAVKSDGSVWAWGSNSAKQVSPSSKAGSFTKPTKVAGLSSVVSVAAGSDFSVALLFDGTVSVWGGGKGISKVPGLSGVSSVSAGQSTLLALKYDGTVWQWPFGASAPNQVPGLQNISAVSAGGGHYLALSYSGQVWAWGSNSSGQLGVGSTKNRIDTPQKVNGLSDIVSVAAGYSHSLAVDYNGQVYAWGSNNSGQLGNDTTKNSGTPQAVLTIKKAVQVSAGNETSMAFTSDNRVYTWGYGEYGQLGSNSTSNYRTKPDTVSSGGFGTPVLIASGMNHNMLLNNRGAVYTWGRNRDGQLGTDKNANGTTPQNINLSLSADNSYSYTLGKYSTNAPTGMSRWAVNDLTALYHTGMVPPSLWERYNQNITRAEFAHLVVTVYEQVRRTTINPGTQTNFQDIKNHPLEQSILKAYQIGLLNGRSNTVFAPNDFMKRQEAAKLLCTLVTKLQGVRIPTQVDSLSYYSDAYKVSSWAIPYVAFAYEQNIMRGSGGQFNPAGYTTREQALAIISRLADRYGWA